MKRLALVLGALLLVTACRKHGAHDHADAHPAGHDHHEEGHGHADGPVVRITLWSKQFELFAEHAPAIVGREVTLLAHLTVLEGFKALDSSEVEVELEGPAKLRGSAPKALRPGIFQLSVTPTVAGKYKGRVRVKGSSSGTVEGVELTVFENDEAASRAAPPESHSGLIEFLKEQQWGVAFGTDSARKGKLSASVEVSGRIGTPPGGSAEVGAPVTGRLVAPSGGLPRPGDEVKKGRLLASLVPTPSSPEDGARAGLAVVEAEGRAAAAAKSVERARRLLKDEAISKREVEDAEREAQVAQEAVRAAKRASALYAGASGSGAGGGWRLKSPITGTIVAVNATPGATVSPGDVLFRVVDPKEVWIIARVSEQDVVRVRTDRDASYRVAGQETWQPLSVSGPNPAAKIVTVGRTVDPVSRTVDVIYSLLEPDESLRIGGRLDVSLPTGEEFLGVVVPRNALIDQDGRDVVYVQVDGEHFEERQVRTGPRAGGAVGVVSGLKTGERVVTRGAHLVRLADRAKNAQPHGHVH